MSSPVSISNYNKKKLFQQYLIERHVKESVIKISLKDGNNVCKQKKKK